MRDDSRSNIIQFPGRHSPWQIDLDANIATHENGLMVEIVINQDETCRALPIKPVPSQINEDPQNMLLLAGFLKEGSEAFIQRYLVHMRGRR